MLNHTHIETVPAYYARTTDGHCIPFIITLLFYDKEGNERIPPAVEQAINKTIEITQRKGLAIAKISDQDILNLKAKNYLERAMSVPGAIAFFKCENAEIAENLMQYFNETYELSLVKETISL